MARTSLINVELVFASEEKQKLLSVKVGAGTTALDAIIKSALPQDFPDVDFLLCTLGIWGRPVSGGQVLRDGDRVEAYRSLRRDPRDARRELALAGKSMGGSGNREN